MSEQRESVGRLPDRAAIVDRFAGLINAGRGGSGDSPMIAATVCVIEVDEPFDNAEITRRLDRLVRSGDLLGQLGPSTFVLVARSLAPADAGTVLDRIRGAIAMPMETAAGAVSPRCELGAGFFDGRDPTIAAVTAADSTISHAERELAHRRRA